jgi:hypothetical protein
MLSAGVSSATFAQDDAFRRGMDARQGKRHKEVVGAMRQAIAADPKESTRKVGSRLGLGGDEYLPHFYLGEALLAIDDCAGALNAWEESEKQGIAPKVGSNGRVIQTGYMQCDAKGFLRGPRLAKEDQGAAAAYRAALDEVQALLRDIKEHPDVKIDPAVPANTQAQITAADEKLAAARGSRRIQDFFEVRTLSEGVTRTAQNTRQIIATAVAGAEAFTRRSRDVDSQLLQADMQMRDLDALLASTTPLKVAPSEAVTAERARAATLLTSARDKLRGASQTRADADVSEAARIAQDALTAVGRARTQYDTEVDVAIATEIAGLETRGTDLFAEAEARARAIEEKLRTHPEAADATTELAKLQSTLTRARRNFDRSIKSRDLAGAQTAALAPAQLGPQFDSLAARLGIAAGPVLPEALLRAAQALFDGRYEDVFNALSSDAAASMPVMFRIHAHVIRSAALFAMYESSGASDDTLRARARDEASIGRGLDAAFRPSSAAFSPRFISFFLAAPQAPR